MCVNVLNLETAQKMLGNKEFWKMIWYSVCVVECLMIAFLYMAFPFLDRNLPTKNLFCNKQSGNFAFSARILWAVRTRITEKIPAAFPATLPIDKDEGLLYSYRRTFGQRFHYPPFTRWRRKRKHECSEPDSMYTDMTPPMVQSINLKNKPAESEWFAKNSDFRIRLLSLEPKWHFGRYERGVQHKDKQKVGSEVPGV